MIGAIADFDTDQIRDSCSDLVFNLLLWVTYLSSNKNTMTRQGRRNDLSAKRFISANPKVGKLLCLVTPIEDTVVELLIFQLVTV